MQVNCPIPIQENNKIKLAHGGGSKLSNKLINDIIIREFNNEWLNQMHDGAIINLNGPLAFCTDSFVVNPLFFPGGDIGDLAVNGTVNDLTCCGAKPKFISLALILEEGLEIDILKKVIQSISKSAEKAGVKIVTGDTKVVEKGKGDQIFINTSGIGEILPGLHINAQNLKEGDKIILSGTLADHGVAIMSSREGIAFETSIKSDTAPLNDLLLNVYNITKNIKMMRDPTRGGLASALNEIASAANKEFVIWENELPIHEEVRGACEILGLDPLYIANEGKMLFFVEPKDAEKVVSSLKNHPQGKNAAIIGEVKNGRPLVKLQTTIASHRIIDMISGEQLPRIC